VACMFSYSKALCSFFVIIFSIIGGLFRNFNGLGGHLTHQSAQTKRGDFPIRTTIESDKEVKNAIFLLANN